MELTNDLILVSIIIPTFNAAEYLENLLPAIALQTFQQYEILILDNFSTDGTAEVIQSNQASNTRIRYVSEQDKGIYYAMNKGIEMSKGEWLYFMGSDDCFFDINVLQTISANLTANYDLVYGDVLWVPDNILESGSCKPIDLINRNINHQRIFYRKELFLQFGGYDLQYKVASDHELNIRFFCNNNIRKKYLPVTIAKYHSGGFSANKMDEVFWSNWKQIFHHNFLQHESKRESYNKLGWYCRYLIDKHQYRKAFLLFWDVFSHTGSPGFVKLTFKQLIRSFRKHAS
ncbi:MAG: glycosyltransferase family 2 protein [Lacibacter sp.]